MCTLFGWNNVKEKRTWKTVQREDDVREEEFGKAENGQKKT